MIPAWIGLPFHAVATIAIVVVVAIVAVMVTAADFLEASGAAAIHPQAVMIETPGLAAHTARVGQLLFEPGVAPRHVAALPRVILTRAFDRVARVCSGK